jgi:protein-S-isoprenylcysteine O-methyltransferase Ste14
MNLLETKLPPVALTLLLAVVAWFLAYVFPLASLNFAFQALFAACFLVTGAAISLAGVYAFRVSHTTVNPTTPNGTTSLVTSGVYRYTRNPMYVGFGLALLAVVVYLGSIASSLVLPLYVVYMNRFQIRPEERMLLEKFGEPFATYLRNGRRWL